MFNDEPHELHQKQKEIEAQSTVLVNNVTFMVLDIDNIFLQQLYIIFSNRDYQKYFGKKTNSVKIM